MIITIIMAVVMLSRTAERKNVMSVSFHSSPTLLFDTNFSRTKSKPPFVSTTSTMTMAPRRKKRISDVSPSALVKAETLSAEAPHPM